MTEYGYARVSSKDQNLDRQLDALRGFGITRRCIYADKASGASFERPRYRALVRRLRQGDVLVIASVDRLGRNYDEILEQWRHLIVKKRVDIVVLDMPLLDTRASSNRAGGVTGKFISDIVLQLLSYVAQIERENIRHRQAQGIAAARARGKRFGRPLKLRPAHYEAVANSYERGEISKTSAAKSLGVSRITFDKWRAQDREEADGEGATDGASALRCDDEGPGDAGEASCQQGSNGNSR